MTEVGSAPRSLGLPFPCLALFLSRGPGSTSLWRVEGGARDADIARASCNWSWDTMSRYPTVSFCGSLLFSPTAAPLVLGVGRKSSESSFRSPSSCPRLSGGTETLPICSTATPPDVRVVGSCVAVVSAGWVADGSLFLRLRDSLALFAAITSYLLR
jgi:hypothetical protein